MREFIRGWCAPVVRGGLVKVNHPTSCETFLFSALKYKKHFYSMHNKYVHVQEPEILTTVKPLKLVSIIFSILHIAQKLAAIKVSNLQGSLL